MNVSQSNPDIIGTESVMEDGSDLTVMVNESRNRLTTRITTHAMERNGRGMVTKSGLGLRGQAKNSDLTRALAPPHLLIF